MYGVGDRFMSSLDLEVISSPALDPSNRKEKMDRLGKPWSGINSKPRHLNASSAPCIFSTALSLSVVSEQLGW